MTCAVPMSFTAHITRSRKQQARHFTLPDPFTDFLGKVRMHVSQHHRIDVAFVQPSPRQALEQTRRLRLATAGARKRRQQVLGAGHDQDVFALLLHQQHPRSNLYRVVVVGFHPVGPKHTRRMPEQHAAIQSATLACQCGNATAQFLPLG
ncbi:hypothetical protein D3C86_1429090 [compost metagenome]